MSVWVPPAHAGIGPTYRTPEGTITAFMHMVEYRRNQKQLRETPALPDNLTANATAAHNLLRSAIEDGARALDTHEVQPILDASPSVPPPLLEVGSIRMLVELAEAGHHVSIMTPIGAHNEISRGSLLFRSLDEPGLSANRFGLMVRAGTDLHFAPAVFYEHAKEHFRGLELPGAART